MASKKVAGKITNRATTKRPPSTKAAKPVAASMQDQALKAKTGALSQSPSFDYRRNEIPKWVNKLITKYVTYGTETEEASLGFMARALVQATMPYKDPKQDVFTRRNGDLTLRMVAGYAGGLPYGIYPRLLMGWIATEAVRTQSPRIELGSSLSAFLRDVLDISNAGGKRGNATRVTEQMKRLFGSLVSVQYIGGKGTGFNLRNVMVAQQAAWDGAFVERLKGALDNTVQKPTSTLWVPQSPEDAGNWDSYVDLTPNFFQECVTRPVPINLSAYKDLRGSPLAMDVYTWCTYRMSYLKAPSRPIPWHSLMNQFGSNFTTESAVRDFKKAFLQAAKAVEIVYPGLNIQEAENGLVLLPSSPHVKKLALSNSPTQPKLF